jgi:hypothetical protein
MGRRFPRGMMQAAAYRAVQSLKANDEKHLDDRALLFLLDREPHGSTCTVIGDHLFGAERTQLHAQAYARPAGRLLHRLKRAGLVFDKHVPGCFATRWCLSIEGQKKARALRDAGK